MTREEGLEFIAKSMKDDVDMAMVADAIEALSAEPCEDAISRQAVLELPRRTMRNYFGEIVGDVVYIDGVEALPPVTPKQKTGWIPVSDGLPDLPQGEDEVLITLEDEDGDRDVYKGFYEDGLWWTQMYCGCNKISIANPRSRVVAWMYLPEPYKAESETK